MLEAKEEFVLFMVPSTVPEGVSRGSEDRLVGLGGERRDSGAPVKVDFCGEARADDCEILASILALIPLLWAATRSSN